MVDLNNIVKKILEGVSVRTALEIGIKESSDVGEEIIGYSYEVWFDSSCLHEDDYVYDTEEEAQEAAEDFCEDRIEQWKSDGGYHGETVDDFNIVINDVTE